MMYQCSKCKGLFDAGELHGGVCDECVEMAMAEAERKEQAGLMRRRCLSEQNDGQLVMVL